MQNAHFELETRVCFFYCFFVNFFDNLFFFRNFGN